MEINKSLYLQATEVFQKLDFPLKYAKYTHSDPSLESESNLTTRMAVFISPMSIFKSIDIISPVRISLKCPPGTCWPSGCKYGKKISERNLCQYHAADWSLHFRCWKSKVRTVYCLTATDRDEDNPYGKWIIPRRELEFNRTFMVFFFLIQRLFKISAWAIDCGCTLSLLMSKSSTWRLRI